MKDIINDLHHGFSEDYNSILGSIIALIIGVLAIIGGYGYVYINSSTEIETSVSLFKENDLYTVNSLAFATFGVCISLWGILRILIYQGFAGRLQQFIPYEIRRRAGIDPRTNNDTILPGAYHPLGKKGFEIIHGLYGQIILIISILLITVYIATFYRVTDGFCKIATTHCRLVVTLAVSLFIVIIDLLCFWNRKEKKYHKREIEYLKKI
ncbi:MAG: hypothetical protein J1F07_02425 [Muribaculaceae bacterium]|nr:hypothetical protein [Muribaculaceae bacterium]